MTLGDVDPFDLAVWRALDLQRAYAHGNRAVIATLLVGLERAQIIETGRVLIDNHNKTMTVLSGLRGTDVRARALLQTIDEVAALAPAESEFAITTAVREVAEGRRNLTDALGALEEPDRLHAVAIYLTAATLSAFGGDKAKNMLEDTAVLTEQLGSPRPYPQPIPV